MCLSASCREPNLLGRVAKSSLDCLFTPRPFRKIGLSGYHTISKIPSVDLNKFLFSGVGYSKPAMFLSKRLAVFRAHICAYWGNALPGYEFKLFPYGKVLRSNCAHARHPVEW